MKHMKCFGLFPLLVLLALSLVSCDSLNQPLGSGDSNPLDAPIANAPREVVEEPSVSQHIPGTFLQTESAQTSFFSFYPKVQDQPSKILPDYTDVKVISNKGSYVKVEVVDSGEVGYVPAVMLGDKREPEPSPVVTDTPAAPVAPFTPDIPSIAPDPEIPGLGPPEVIDLSRPAE